jgi:cytochrome d ubiquinol oxidase subunit II
VFGVPAEALVACVAVVAIALYAIFGGADFGGGVWDVLASGPRRSQQQEIIGHAIGPVWETNHVWLIFMIVLLFTCFPPAFAALSIGLYTPLTFVLVGIILRGAAYAFRSQAYREARLSQLWGHVFGIASVVSPFFFGTCVGGLTVGNFAWTSPFALCVGLLAVALCAQIAAVFLTCEVRGPVRQDFRTRGMIVTIVLAGIGAIALASAEQTAPHVFAALRQPQSLPGIRAHRGLHRSGRDSSRLVRIASSVSHSRRAHLRAGRRATGNAARVSRAHHVRRRALDPIAVVALSRL